MASVVVWSALEQTSGLALPEAHVTVAGLLDQVIIYRSKEGLGVRYAGKKFEVNDQQFLDRAPLPLPASFDSGALSFSVEPVGPRL